MAKERDHFDLEKDNVESVEDVLLKLKKLAHQRVYGGREFGHDAAEDAKKPVAISVEQPTVAKAVSPFLFEGDIFLSKKQAINILNEASKVTTDPKKRGRGRRSFDASPESKWPVTAPIKYRFHESLDFVAVSKIIKAIEYWENVTCLTFENSPLVSETEDYIEFFQGQGCYSMIGRNGGRQGVSIGENCVKVESDFILPSFISDFMQRDAKDIDTLGIPYDLGSVMHYGSTAFSADQTSKTLVTRDPLYQSTIGQRETLSFFDIDTINKAYCSGSCSGKNNCKNGGYPHPSQCDICLCPNGLAGNTCEDFEPPHKADCGGKITVNDEWQSIESPGFPDPGYDPDQKCSWGRRQEFSTCNLDACPIDKHCAKLLESDKLCDGRTCVKPTAALSRCNEPQCCPPFINVNGKCQSDSAGVGDLIRK
ncbi:hypothetical protein RB195_007847 [Necator americanus]|uniref:Metalloendopeptidase n=1 Tax=Necator americanus TaxID=51031 RepID=A0ABR1BZA3_NECAM